MAMNKLAMAQAIIQGFAEADTPQKAMSQLSRSLKDYLEANLEVDYSWAATLPNPPNTADPVVKFTSSVTFPTLVLTNPPTLLAWGPLISTAVAGGIITHPKDFLVPPGSFSPVPFTITESKADNQKDAIEHLSQNIIDGIKRMLNPLPLSGSHPPYTSPTPGAIMVAIR